MHFVGNFFDCQFEYCDKVAERESASMAQLL